MNEAQLENIELRAAGAVGTPWKIAGDGVLIRGSNGAARKALRTSDVHTGEGLGAQFDKKTFEAALRIATVSPDLGIDDQKSLRSFFLHAPTDIESLVWEVRRLQKCLAQTEDRRVDTLTELGETRRERDRARDRVNEIEAGLAAFKKVLS